MNEQDFSWETLNADKEIKCSWKSKENFSPKITV